MVADHVARSQKRWVNPNTRLRIPLSRVAQGEPLRVADREPVRDVTGFRALRFSFWGESSFQTSA